MPGGVAVAAQTGNRDLLKLPNRILLIDQDGKLIEEKEVSTDLGVMTGIASDPENKRFFIALDNKVLVVGEDGTNSWFPAPKAASIDAISYSPTLIKLFISHGGDQIMFDKLSPKIIVLDSEAIESLLRKSGESRQGVSSLPQLENPS